MTLCLIGEDPVPSLGLGGREGERSRGGVGTGERCGGGGSERAPRRGISKEVNRELGVRVCSSEGTM